MCSETSQLVHKRTWRIKKQMVHVAQQQQHSNPSRQLTLCALQLNVIRSLALITDRFVLKWSILAKYHQYNMLIWCLKTFLINFNVENSNSAQYFCGNVIIFKGFLNRKFKRTFIWNRNLWSTTFDILLLHKITWPKVYTFSTNVSIVAIARFNLILPYAKKNIRQHHRRNHFNIFSWCDSSYHRAWLTWTHLVKQNTHNKVSYYEINWGLCSQRAAHLKTIIIFSRGFENVVIRAVHVSPAWVITITWGQPSKRSQRLRKQTE